MRLILAFLASCVALLGAECATTIRIHQDSKGTSLVNGTDKAIIAYFLFDPDAKDSVGNFSRTYHGIFTSGDSLRSKKSIEVRKEGASAGRLAIDYVLFLDGSSCGMAATPEAKRVSDRSDK
jgi:hypothetical protein